MTKISIRDAVSKFQVSRPTITKSLNNGNISGEKNSKGVWMIETSELSRVYKARTPLHDKEHPNLTTVNMGENTLENQYMKGKLEALESYVDDLKEQRNKAENRAEIAEARVTALLSDQGVKRRSWWPW
jgi:hypothetical protein